jgi:retinol dehydrogenase-12
LARNAKVYIAARSQEKTEAAIKDLKDQTGKEAIWLKLDLSDLNAVKASAEEFLRCVTSYPSKFIIDITN